MRVEKYPAGYPLKSRFPNLRAVAGFEGGGIDFAEQDGRYYVIMDEGGVADLLDEVEDADIIRKLITVYVFDAEAERELFIKEKSLGWYWLPS